ncbi:hypothetical protein GCM10008094_23410 [Aidingimonas halophila]|nr:hypothetical protein GCM10008094_23410 [Aidingimonas halophila]
MWNVILAWQIELTDDAVKQLQKMDMPTPSEFEIFCVRGCKWQTIRAGWASL